MDLRVTAGADMIRQMNPVIVPGRWAFRTVAEGELAGLLPVARAIFREDEGISVLVPAQAGEVAMAQITLQVFSDLEGVGLTAAVSDVLAKAGIACNVIAATLHDHVFVPEASAARALVLLQQRAGREVS